MHSPHSANYFLLNQINQVGDIKKLSRNQLDDLALELRKFLIASTEKTGGHLSSNLGVVELTIALHFVLDLPQDEIIWDVSHQSYIHKILTERKDKMTTLRQKGGISGFANIKESPYDPFGAGHACTSISAALGIAQAKKLQNDDGLVVAVIGDGAMTGGLAYEALNNSSLNQKSNILIILNDNKMSISENIGGISKILSNLIHSSTYRQLKNTSKRILKKSPTKLMKFAKKSEHHFKEILLGGNLFEQLGVNYSGPIDGHNIDQLIDWIDDLKKEKKINLLHIQTQKGKGIIEAEIDPLKYHGVKAKINNQEQPLTIKKRQSYSEIFGTWLTNMAKKKPKMIAVTPAMSQGSGMDEFAKQYPEQFFDVGIAEQHSLTFCAGFAAKGEKPILAIYSTFLQRAYDQLIHDVLVQDLDVTLAIDRAGVVGEDGPTHSGQFDISFLRILPKIVIMCPSDEIEMVKMLTTAYEYKGLAAVRYPKGNSDEIITQKEIKEEIKKNQMINLGEARIIKNASNPQNSLALLCFGDLLFQAKKVAKELDLTLVDMRFVKPLDEAVIKKMAKTHKAIATIEENTTSGGAGSAVSEFLIRHEIFIPIKHLGIDDQFVAQGIRKTLLDEMGLSHPKITKTLITWLKTLK